LSPFAFPRYATRYSRSRKRQSVQLTAAFARGTNFRQGAVFRGALSRADRACAFRLSLALDARMRYSLAYLSPI
jgi:hypothetical protein